MLKRTVSGNYHQFYIRDNDCGDTCDAWNEETYEKRIAAGKGFVTVGTLTTLEIPVTIDLVKDIPDLNEFDLINEIEVTFNSNDIHLLGCVEDPSPSSKLEIEPGSYKVVVGYGGQDQVESEFDLCEYFHVYLQRLNQ